MGSIYRKAGRVSRVSEPASLSDCCARSKDDHIVTTLVSRSDNAEDVVIIRIFVIIIDALFVFCSLASCAANKMLPMELHRRRM